MGIHKFCYHGSVSVTCCGLELNRIRIHNTSSEVYMVLGALENWDPASRVGVIMFVVLLSFIFRDRAGL
jgi:hypothetical protein